MDPTTPPPARDQVISQVNDIMHWYKSIPGKPERRRRLASPTPTTNTEEKLPFGLDATIDDLDDGPTGIRTASGARRHLEHLAYWLWTSGFPSSPPNYETPGPWIRTMLETPYPWEQWGISLTSGETGGEWEEWATDVSQTHRVIARLTGRSAVKAGTCPGCGGTLLASMTSRGQSDEARCYACDLTTSLDTLPDGQRESIRQSTSDILITGAQAIDLWSPDLTHDTLRDWVRHGRITHTDTRPRTYPLREINALTVELKQHRT